jgi:glycine/serine hydroxymethyltransferase
MFITEQLKKMVIEEEARKNQVCDLIHSENVEREAAALKATNLELQGKVCHFITTFLVLSWA